MNNRGEIFEMHEIGDRKRIAEDKLREKAQLQQETEEKQHAAIDRLEEYLGEIDGKRSGLRNLRKALREEILSLFPKKTPD